MIQIGVRQFFRFNQQVPVLRVLGTERCQRLPGRPMRYAGLQNIQDLERRPGLRGGRQFENVVTMIRSARRLDPFSSVARKMLTAIGTRLRTMDQALP